MLVVHGRSRPGRALNLDRKRGAIYDILWKDYSPTPFMISLILGKGSG